MDVHDVHELVEGRCILEVLHADTPFGLVPLHHESLD